MKIITLSGPAVIDGAVRYPIEGPLTVSDEEAQRQKGAGRLDGEPEDLPKETDEDEADDDGLDAMTIPALKTLAETDKIELGEASKKADIVAAIRAHRAAQ